MVEMCGLCFLQKVMRWFLEQVQRTRDEDTRGNINHGHRLRPVMIDSASRDGWWQRPWRADSINSLMFRSGCGLYAALLPITNLKFYIWAGAWRVLILISMSKRAHSLFPKEQISNLLKLSISSWAGFGNVYVSKNFFVDYLNLLAFNCSWFFFFIYNSLNSFKVCNNVPSFINIFSYFHLLSFFLTLAKVWSVLWIFSNN